MRFYSQDPRTVNVSWYFVDEATPFIPYSTPFRSLNYDNERIGNPEVLGEVYGAPRPWRNGSKVGDSAGTNFCGTAEQWRDGQAVPSVPPVEVDGTGTPTCCDGAGPPAPPLVTTCQFCPAGAAQTYTVRVEGVISPPGLPCDELNRDYLATYVTACAWQIPDVVLSNGTTWAAGLSRYDAGNWLFELVNRASGEDGFGFLIPSADCLTAVQGTVTVTGHNQTCTGLPGFAFATIIPGPHS